MFLIPPTNDTTVNIFVSFTFFVFYVQPFSPLSQHHQTVCVAFLEVIVINDEGVKGKTILSGTSCKMHGLPTLRLSVTTFIFQFTCLSLLYSFTELLSHISGGLQQALVKRTCHDQLKFSQSRPWSLLTSSSPFPYLFLKGTLLFFFLKEVIFDTKSLSILFH